MRYMSYLLHSVTGIYLVLIPVTMKETRGSVLLTRLARKLRRETGNHRYRARVEDERGSMKELILISCTRPICMFLDMQRAMRVY
jgi:hypothetical protein